jgi:hypothetical protein
MAVLPRENMLTLSQGDISTLRTRGHFYFGLTYKKVRIILKTYLPLRVGERGGKCYNFGTKVA